VIYVTGITGLGVVAAAGGLAAAAAVRVGTLALLSISGGFTAGTFAVIDNADLAKSYTIAAKRVDTALTEADGMLPSGSRLGNPEACGDALLKLKESVTDARTILEASRTDVAVGAIDRAREAQKTMTALLAAQPGPVTQVTRSAEISAIDGKTGTVPVKPDDVVTLTAANGQPDRGSEHDHRAVGSRDAPWWTCSRQDGRLRIHREDPGAVTWPTPGATYRPALLVGPGKQRIPARTDLPSSTPERSAPSQDGAPGEPTATPRRRSRE
jgi:hypothetical protein